MERASQEAVTVVAAASELFLTYLAEKTLNAMSGKTLDYSDLARVVATDSKLEFLRGRFKRERATERKEIFALEAGCLFPK